MKGKSRFCTVIRFFVGRYQTFERFYCIGGLAASPFGNDVFKLEKSKREAMFQSIHDTVSDYLDGNCLAAPMESYVVSAKKQLATEQVEEEER